MNAEKLRSKAFFNESLGLVLAATLPKLNFVYFCAICDIQAISSFIEIEVICQGHKNINPQKQPIDV